MWSDASRNRSHLVTYVNELRPGFKYATEQLHDLIGNGRFKRTVNVPAKQ